jgi:hypothetical protein
MMNYKNDEKKQVGEDSNERLSSLAKQGRTWEFTEKVSKFERPRIFLDPPMEITHSMLHGLRMVDEIVVVIQGHTSMTDSSSKVQKGGLK